VRSSKASSAARRAASRTKSVRFLPNVLAARSIRPRSSGLMRRLRDWRLGTWRMFVSAETPLYYRNDNVITSGLHQYFDSKGHLEKYRPFLNLCETNSHNRIRGCGYDGSIRL